MPFVVIGRRQTRVFLIALACLTLSVVAWAAVSRASARGGTNPNLVWYVQTDEPVIALTFDDGPDPTYTRRVLATLRRYGAKATFFVIGRNVEKYPDILREVAAEGHEIGNHTYSHPLRLRQAGNGELVRELTQTDELVTRITGRRTRVFRPPGGAYDDHLAGAVRSLGYEVIIWSWTTNPSDAYGPAVSTIVHRVTDNAAPGDIVLLHDGNPHPQTVSALPEILRILSDKGFRFVTVSELLSLRGPKATEP
ncbi:MAG: polysaccharide deacetylase family protein [Bacillota bacterium]